MDNLELKTTRDSLYFWNIIATIVFVVAVIKIVAITGTEAIRVIADISPFHFLLVSLTTFRLTRLFVADHITAWMRDLCMKKVSINDPLTGAVFVRKEKHLKGLRRLISDILGCPWCVGVWVALGTIVLYYTAVTDIFSAGWMIILVFSLSGAAELVYAIVVALLSPYAGVGFEMHQRGSNLLGSAKRAPSSQSTNVCTECGV